MKRPDYQYLENLLDAHDFSTTPSELHGSLCAQLSLVHDLNTMAWLNNAMGSEVRQQELGTELEVALQWLFKDTRHALLDSLLSFTLFLPDDGLELRDRTEGMAQWCQGYLTAASVCGLTDFSELPENAREFLEDVTNIAMAEVLEDEGVEDEDENAYFELIEYLRIGSVLLFELYRTPDDTQRIH